MKKIILLTTIILLSGCIHRVKKAPCNFDEYKNNDTPSQTKEDYTK